MAGRRVVLFSLAALEAACGEPKQPPLAVSEVVLADAGGAPALPPPETTDPKILLARYALVDARPARRTLYTWTTREQVDELVADKQLLTRTTSPTKGESHFEEVLEARAQRDERLAKLLREDAFARARFAWNAPWATVLGWPGETYGDQLITVVLKPDAWIVRMRSSTATLDVIDLENRPVPYEKALAAPERIAAVYFVNDAPRGRGYGSFGSFGGGPRMAYREFVLCNESMIESWSVGTQAEQDVMQSSARAITALAEHIASESLPPREPSWVYDVTQLWRLDDPGADPFVLYDASLAIPNELYVPNLEPLRALAKQLRELPGGGPSITYRPTAAFVRKKKQP